jgi:hypothetical protein
MGVVGVLLILAGNWAGWLGHRELGLGVGLVDYPSVPAALNLVAQEGQNVNISQGPPAIPYQKLFFYDGSDRIEYVCMAIGPNPSTTTFSITGATSANPAVFTASGYGLYTQDAATRSKVTISGAAAPWTGVNTSWLVSPVNATTFQLLSITTGTAFDGSALGAWSGTATATTNAPRTNIGIWAIEKLTYSGTGKIKSVMWANTGSLVRNKCDDRAAAYTEYR